MPWRFTCPTRRAVLERLPHGGRTAVVTCWRLSRPTSVGGNRMWGATGLSEYGFDVITPPFSTMPRLKRVMDRYGADSWGDCDQQLRAFWRRDYDVVYAACQHVTGLLAQLHRYRLFRKPIVALLHHELSDNAASRSFLGGHTRLLCLSRGVQAQLTDVFQVPKEHVDVLDWGAELEFYGAIDHEPKIQEPLVASVGKTHRDHDTLVAALRDLAIPLTIVGTPPARGFTSPRLTVIPASEQSARMPIAKSYNSIGGQRSWLSRSSRRDA